MTVIIRPQGDLDLKNSSLLQQQFARSLAEESAVCYAIDFEGVNFINNFGLMTLISIRRLAREKGCRLYLLNLKESVKYIMEITGLDREFNILDEDGFQRLKKAYKALRLKHKHRIQSNPA
ncbi:MAG: STAS domain-containing protein [Okeania sp. SIO2H7]|nr:STAS domain-containing protein [Okeania sp. SIO2H7]